MANDITIGFEDKQGIGSGDLGSSSNALTSLLQNLNKAIEKLNINLSKANSAIGKPNATSTTIATNDNKYDKELSSLGNRIGTILGASLGIALGSGFARYFNAQAGAIMGRASATGNFISQAIQGNANSALGGYVGSLFNTEKARQIAINQATSEATYGVGGAVVGGLGGGLIGGITGLLKGGIGGAIGGLEKGSLVGSATLGAIGASYGNYKTSLDQNQFIERNLAVQSAYAQRQANASISEWQTSFSRWGNPMSSSIIASKALTGNSAISVPLSSQFEQQYGKSQNYNSILNNIAPFLNNNPLSRQNGNLDDVAQRFLKAGFAVSDFTKLTIQSSQYSAITGKNIDQFSQDIVSARQRFGSAFNTGTMQTALNLMSIGYDKSDAQSIAYQSQFNPNLASNVNRYANQGRADFYRNRAISQATGININKSLETGHFVGSASSRAELTKELAQYQAGTGYGNLLTILNQGAGFTPATLHSLLQPKASINNAIGLSTNAKLSPAQQNANIAQGLPSTPINDLVSTIESGLKNIDKIFVQAKDVTITSSSNHALANYPAQHLLSTYNVYPAIQSQPTKITHNNH